MNLINITSNIFFAVFLLFILFLRNKKFNKLNIILSMIVVAIGSFLISQRPIYPQDDLINYLNLYENIRQGNWASINNFAGGLEFGFPVLLFSLTFFDIVLNEVQFAFFSSLFIGYLFLYVVYRIWIEHYSDFPLSIILVLSISFFSFFAATHNLRQDISSILLFYALICTSKNKYLILFLASAFHISAILIYQFFILINSLSKLIILIILTFMLRFYMDSIIDFVTYQEYFIGKEKFSAFKITIDELTIKDKYFNLVKLSFLGILYAFNYKNIPDKFKPLFYFILFGISSYLIFFDYQMPVDRILNLILNMFYGLVAFVFLYKSSYIYILSIIGIIYQSYLLYVYFSMQ